MTAPSMLAWTVDHPGPIDEHPLGLTELALPEPRLGEVLVRVHACGVCRTDLHLSEGDLAPKHAHIAPGHEIVGTVERLGAPLDARFRLGERIGVAWLGRTCQQCRFCRSGRENLCLTPSFTGWDTHGGYGSHVIVDERFAYRLPASYDDIEVAPLLCAGIIGYRALERAELPAKGRLGLYGFGASAHITAQIALAAGATVHVLTRSEQARQLALELGAASVGDAADMPPEPLDSAILFAPAGELVLPALAALERGGTLAIAGIHLSDIPTLNYQAHLFEERTVRSVTANTRSDGERFLKLADEIGIRVTTTPYPMSNANQALCDLAHDRVNGAAVLVADESF